MPLEAITPTLGLGPSGGALVFSNGASVGSTQVAYGDSAGRLTSEAAFTYDASTNSLSVDPDADSGHVFGRARIGAVTSGVADSAYFAHYDLGATSYAVRQLANGQTILNASSGQTILLRINNTDKITLSTSAATFASGVPVTISDTTASSSITTGALIVSGGAGIAGSLFAANIISSANVRAAGSLYGKTFGTVKTGTYTVLATDYIVPCDASGGDFTITLPAANTVAAQSQTIRVKNMGGSGTVTVSRAGSDTIDGANTTTIAAGASKDFGSDGSSRWWIL